MHVFLQDNHKGTTESWAQRFGRMAQQDRAGREDRLDRGDRNRRRQPQQIDYLVTTTDDEPEQYAPKVLAALQDTPGAINVNSSALRTCAADRHRFRSRPRARVRYQYRSRRLRRFARHSAERWPRRSRPRTASNTCKCSTRAASRPRSRRCSRCRCAPATARSFIWSTSRSWCEDPSAAADDSYQPRDRRAHSSESLRRASRSRSCRIDS